MAKKILPAVIVLLLLTAGLLTVGHKDVGAQPAAKEAAPLVLKFAHSSAPEGMMDLRARKMAELVAAKTNKKVNITIYPASQLGGPKERLQGISMGTIDMGVEAETFLDLFEKDYIIFSTPFLFAREELRTLPLLNELREKVRAKTSIRTLPGVSFRPSFQLWTKKAPIMTPEQLNKSKIRVWESVGVVAVWNALGATAISIPWAETYLSLAQNICDGIFHNNVQIYEEKFFEQLDYAMQLKGLELFDATWINDGRFNSLSKEHQNALMEASVESAAWLEKYIVELEKKAIQGASAKVKFVEVDRAPWVKKSLEAAIMLENKGTWSKGLLAKLKKN